MTQRVPVPASILEEKVLPVARGLDAEGAVRVAKALADGGISTLEVTVEAAGGIEAIAALAGSGTIVGAGTVTNVAEARSAVESGAQFLVTPHLELPVVDLAVELGIPIISGCLTPTEANSAWSRGASAVKVFPAFVGGPQYITSLKAPYPELALIPTGGITGENAAAFMDAGAAAVGVGAWLTAHGDMATVTRRAKQLLESVV